MSKRSNYNKIPKDYYPTTDPNSLSPKFIEFIRYIAKCSKVVSVGRLKWFKDSKHASTDNFCWYFWQKGATDDTTTVFYGRSQV